MVSGDSFKDIVRNAGVSAIAGAVSFEAKRFAGRNPQSDIGFLAASKVVEAASSVRANILQGKGAFGKITLSYLVADINIGSRGIKPTLNLLRTAEIAAAASFSTNKFDTGTTFSTGVAHFTRDSRIGVAGANLPDLPAPFGGAITYANMQYFGFSSDKILGHARVHNLDFRESVLTLGEGIQIMDVDDTDRTVAGFISDPRVELNALTVSGVGPYILNSLATRDTGISRFHSSDLFYFERNANVLSGTEWKR